MKPEAITFKIDLNDAEVKSTVLLFLQKLDLHLCFRRLLSNAFLLVVQYYIIHFAQTFSYGFSKYINPINIPSLCYYNLVNFYGVNDTFCAIIYISLYF
jgi:hypothetical protein